MHRGLQSASLRGGTVAGQLHDRLGLEAEGAMLPQDRCWPRSPEPGRLRCQKNELRCYVQHGTGILQESVV